MGTESWKESKEQWEHIANEKQKEIERLKRLVETLFKESQYQIILEQSDGSPINGDNVHEEIADQWQQFKTDDNL